MGVHILSDERREYSSVGHAVLFCSTTDWAFGPVFTSDDDHDATERAEAFCRWLGTRDPRSFTDAELEAKYADWRTQEAAQWHAEAAAEAAALADDDEPIRQPFPPARPGRCAALCGIGFLYPCDSEPGHTGGHHYSEDDYPAVDYPRLVR